jgi:hypothetical protein
VLHTKPVHQQPRGHHTPEPWCNSLLSMAANDAGPFVCGTKFVACITDSKSLDRLMDLTDVLPRKFTPPLMPHNEWCRCFVLSVVGTPNFRPSFKWFSWHSALLGALLSLGSMFLSNPTYAVLSTLFMSGLLALVTYYAPDTGQGGAWGDVRQAIIFHQVCRGHSLCMQHRVTGWVSHSYKFCRPWAVSQSSEGWGMCDRLSGLYAAPSHRL